MTKEIATTNADLNKIHAIGEFGVNELMAMKESIAKKLSIPQFNLFIYQMNRMGLDPSLGHGVPILYGSDVNIRIEYEGLKSLAQKSEGYQGIYAQAICDNDEFEAESDTDGVISKIYFKTKFPRGKVVGSFAVAKRENSKDYIVICDATEFDKYVKKNPTFWKLDNGSIDPDMAKKFAATRAVKGQFNIAVVVEENMLSLNASGVDALESYERQDITPAQPQNAAVEAPKQTKQRNTKEAEVTTVTPPTDEQIKAARNMMTKNFELLQIAKTDRAAYIMDKLNLAEGVIPTYEQQKELLDIMAKDIEKAMTGLPEDLE